MDRAEAIRELTQWRDQMKSHGVPNYGKKLTSIDLAIEALKGNLHCPKCGTIVRDGRQYHDLVYRGESQTTHDKMESQGERMTRIVHELSGCDAESATTTEDCISRQAVTDLLLDAQDGSGQTYEVIRELLHEVAYMPSVSEEEVDYCNNCPYILWDKDCISRQDAIEALTGWETEPLDEDIVRTLEALPPVSQKQVTSKLKNPCDSLLKADSDECKEQKSKLDCISRQQAIEAIEREIDKDYDRNDITDKYYRMTLRLARNIIQDIPSLPPVTPTEQQEHGRLIDADKLLQELFTVDEEEWTTPEIRAILENAPNITPTVSEDCISRRKAIETCDKMYPQVDRQDIKTVIEATPSVTPTERTGEWIENDDFTCSECGYHMIVGGGAYNFCPNCGCKMGGDE